MSYSIRDARWPDDEKAAISFIDGLQRYEHAMEPDRRIDAAVGADYLAVLRKRLAEHGGRVFIAEMDGTPIGWSVFVLDENPIYIVADEQRVGYVAELYVEEHARKAGLGRALIAACEREARERGLKILMIGVLSKNLRARDVYLAAGFEPNSEQLRKYLR